MKRIVISFLAFLLLIVIASGIIYYSFEKNAARINDEFPDEVEGIRSNEIDKKEIDIVKSKATILGIGDILIHSSLYKDAYENGSYNFKPMFELVKPYIEQADLSFANQETMLGGVELGLSSYPQFNSPTEVGDALVDVGVDIVSIANNHTLDAGELAIMNAIDYYDRVGMLYTGAFKSEKDRLQIRTIERNGITFSFLAYTYGTNGIPVPKGKDYLVNLIDIDRINLEIITAKEKSDVVVLSLHFGNEYELLPNETQKFMAREFARTGADIIFGHHPHVLQPFEWIEQGDGRKTFVAYSLGNFLSGQEGLEREIGGIVQLEVAKTTVGGNVDIQLSNPRFLATYTYKHKWRNYKIYPMDQLNDDQILKDAAKHLQTTEDRISIWMPELAFHLN